MACNPLIDRERTFRHPQILYSPYKVLLSLSKYIHRVFATVLVAYMFFALYNN